MPIDARRRLGKRFLLTIGLLTAWPTVAMAQPAAGKFQPDRIDVGRLCVGSTVEASARIFLKDNDLAELKVETIAPDFVHVLRTELGKQTYGNEGTYIVCDVFVAFDTRAAGEFNDKLSVIVGDNKVDVPVQTRIVEPAAGARKVLIAETPFERFATDNAALLDPWRKLVESEGLNVSYLEVERGKPVLRDLDLASFDVVLLSGIGVIHATQSDFIKLKKFVYGGGRLIMAANQFFRTTVEKANEFVTHYGLNMADEEPRGNSLVEIAGADVAVHRLTSGVHKLKFYRPSPTEITGKDNATILVAAPPFPGKGFVALCRSGRGEVVALGESLWWNWIASEQTAGADNLVLLKNLMVEPCAGMTP